MSAPRVLVNSLPKSGTNLLASMLDRVPGLSFKKVTLNRNLARHPVNWIPGGGPETCLAGVDQPKRVRLATVRRVLKGLQPGQYTAGHLPHDPGLEKLLRREHIRSFFVIRDPRDIVVSKIHHVMKRPKHFLRPHYAALSSDRDRLLAAIDGVDDPACPADGIAAKLDMTWPWTRADEVMTVRFEDLIGGQGGGDDSAQTRLLVQIGFHIGLAISEEQAAKIGGDAFGAGQTFRKGGIGGWQEVFDDELKNHFKAACGERLIEMGYEQNNDW